MRHRSHVEILESPLRMLCLVTGGVDVIFNYATKISTNLRLDQSYHTFWKSNYYKRETHSGYRSSQFLIIAAKSHQQHGKECMILWPETIIKAGSKFAANSFRSRRCLGSGLTLWATVYENLSIGLH